LRNRMNANPHSCFMSSLMEIPIEKKAQSYTEITNKAEKGSVRKDIKKPPVFIGMGVVFIRTLDK
jgi:hypothetical protein